MGTRDLKEFIFIFDVSAICLELSGSYLLIVALLGIAKRVVFYRPLIFRVGATRCFYETRGCILASSGRLAHGQAQKHTLRAPTKNFLLATLYDFNSLLAVLTESSRCCCIGNPSKHQEDTLHHSISLVLSRDKSEPLPTNQRWSVFLRIHQSLS